MPQAFDFQKTWQKWQATVFLCPACTSNVHKYLLFKSCQLDVISIVVRVMSCENPDEPDHIREMSRWFITEAAPAMRMGTASCSLCAP